MINKITHHLLEKASKINAIVLKSHGISDRALANQSNVSKIYVNWLWHKFNECQTLQNQWAFMEQQEHITAIEIVSDSNLNLQKAEDSRKK